MKAFVLGVSVIIGACLNGCDGRVRLLYLTPPEASKPPWGVASVVIKIDGTEDVIGIVTEVAQSLAMTRDDREQNSWWIRTGDRFRFMMAVTKEAHGYWTVSLFDWPQTSRSAQSLKAEEMIRAKLNEPNKPVETTSVARPKIRESFPFAVARRSVSHG